ncbi:MAG TPA: dockerin type I repeat-containing protein, partial [Planctomycetota bacterium]|nr:dockerin type I repeat-containing protein [Planctomycetota bacterium]
HVTSLINANLAGKLTWDASATGGEVRIHFDGASTYVALRETWPVAATALDLTLEVQPPDHTTIVLHVDDIDATPEDPLITDRRISSPADTDSDSATVTLTNVAEEGTFDITLTITREGGIEATDVGTLTVIIAPTGTNAALTWSGAAGTTLMPRKEWLWSTNWIGGIPPAKPTTGVITFGNGGASTTGDVTNVLDDDRWIGGLTAQHLTGTHTTAMNGSILTVAGPANFGRNLLVQAFTFANGTLQVGTADTSHELNIAYTPTKNNPSTGEVILVGSELVPYLTNLRVGQGEVNTGTTTVVGKLDMTAGTVADGVLKANQMHIGSDRAEGYIKVGPDTGLTELAAVDILRLGTASRGNNFGRIGDPANGYILPPDVSITLGDRDAGRRCSVDIASQADARYTSNGSIVASSGGACNAYISTMKLGTLAANAASYNATGYGIGILDLSAMDSVTIDAQRIELSAAPPVAVGGHNDGRAYLYLPAGTVTVGDAIIAHPDVDATNSDPTCEGVMRLDGTTFAAATSLTIGPKGRVTTNVFGASCGIDLLDSTALTLTGSATIVFHEDPSAPGLHWGLRWEGDHAAALQALADTGNLTWDDSALTEPASIFVKAGFTYVGTAGALANVTSFVVTDATSGSSIVTNEATVSVAIAAEPAEGETIDGYAVNETGVEPTDGWQASLTSYTIQAASGSTVTLYAWAKDTAGNVGSKTAAIYFNTAVPVVTDVVITDNGDGTATATWTTDIPAEGSLKYGPVAMSGATSNVISEDALGTSHSTTFNIAADVNCKLVIVNTEAASAPFYWPKPWPIDGDANMDCRVNILDLIFIRNKLNQDVATGNNWQADVNEDARINILDLIFVRNKLNTQCP